MIGIGVGIPFNKGIQRLKYLLDEDFAQGATAAYALRLLRDKHSGGIIRCRADDAGTSKGEADVIPILQPDGSKIITLNSPIENFSGTPFSGDGYVLADLVDAGNKNYDGLTSSWYDQSGNLHDASNSTASEQPQIVDSGSVIKENGKPALEFDGSDDGLFNNSSNFTVLEEALFSVLSVDFTNSTAFFRGFSHTNGSQSDNNIKNNLIKILGQSNDETFRINNGGTKLFNIAATDNKQYLKSDFYDGSNFSAFLNQTLKDSETISINPKNLDKISIGDKPNKGSPMKGKMQEIIFYTENKKPDKNKIETNINNHYSIF